MSEQVGRMSELNYDKQFKEEAILSYSDSNNANSLLVTHPLLSKEWHPTKNGDFTPDKATAGMNIKVW